MKFKKLIIGPNAGRHSLAILILLVGMMLFPAHSDPIWHCSRSLEEGLANELRNDTESSTEKVKSTRDITFDESEQRTISIQIIDLFNAYSGGTVFMGTEPLSACFLDRGHSLTTLAMSTLDIDPSSLTALSNSDSIVRSRVIPTRNNSQMESCIAKNHPAIGYLAEIVETDKIGPCF